MSPIISADFTHPYGVLPQRLEDGEERDRYLLGHQVQTARQHINPAILLGIGGRGWSDHQHGSDAGRGAQDLARVLNTSRFGDTDPPVFEGRVIDAKREDDARLAVSRKPGLCFSEPPLRDIATGLAPNSQVVGGQVVSFPSGRSGDSPRPTKTLRIIRAVDERVANKANSDIFVSHKCICGRTPDLPARRLFVRRRTWDRGLRLLLFLERGEKILKPEGPDDVEVIIKHLK